jgi:hypothetical protein
LEAGAANAGPLRAVAQKSADTINARVLSSASAAHNTFLMFVSP